MRILITSGATQEPIDGIRYITNFSSGKTGAVLADFFTAEHSVTFVHSRTSVLPVAPSRCLEYGSFQNLHNLLLRVLTENVFDIIIHAAAVSDYSVSHIELNGKRYQPAEIPKIDSGEELTIKTKRNFKIINRLKDYALFNPGVTQPPTLIGFKLTNSFNKDRQRQEVMRLASQTSVDIIVHNDLHEMKSQGVHLFNVYKADKLLQGGITLDDLGVIILELHSSRTENIITGDIET